MSLETELVGAIKGITQSLSLKELKRRRVQNVRVVTRAGLAALLEELKGKAPARTDASAGGGEARRIARLLEEVEKLGQAKLSLEHEKGLLEAERSRLSAELARVAEAVGQELGKKVGPEELKALVEELARARAERDAVKSSLETSHKQAQAETARVRALSEELEALKNATLTRGEVTARVEEERDRLSRERGRLEEERARYLEERDQYRAERDQCRGERDQFRQERDKFLEEREALRAQRDQYREQRDQFREQRQQLHEENATLARERARLEERLQREKTEREAQAERLAALEKQLTDLTSPPPAPAAEEATEQAGEPTTPPTREIKRPGGATGFGFGFGGAAGRSRSK